MKDKACGTECQCFRRMLQGHGRGKGSNRLHALAALLLLDKCGHQRASGANKQAEKTGQR